MKKTIIKILSYVLVAALAAGTAVFCCMMSENRASTKLDYVRNLLDQCYIGDVDQKAMEDAAASAMVQSLGDRWSHYLTAEEFLEYQDTMANSYVGIGVTIQASEEGLAVVAVTPGSGAEEAGILVDDQIVAIEGQSLEGLTIEESSVLIQGEENTNVKLTVRRGTEELDVSVKRKRIETVVASYEMLEGNVGLVTIENFDQRCASESIAAIEALLAKGAQSLIFDVRNNPGGYKNEMVELLDYLLPEGVLFRSEDYLGREDVDKSDAECLDIPMAVVVNLQSYSAAEFFAAALSEYDAAVVVGEQTFGKGYFQNTYALPDGSAVTLSIGKYYTPEGKSLANVGLKPDVEVPVDDETAALIYYDELEPMEDPQILGAINALNSGNTP